MAIRRAASFLVLGASALFGSTGIAHAHGTHVAPEPQVPLVRTHHGPFSVLHQGLVPGPFSVLHEAR
jgi:hypothetical protein